MKLLEALQNIQYDNSWGIWAELLDGKLTEESPARYGQVQFENGGLLDNYVMVCTGELPADRLVEWCDDSDESEWDWQFTETLLNELNEGLPD